jgi:SulP family sulfate permease
MKWFLNNLTILHWLPHYQRSDFRGDLTAGLTVAMMLIPQAMSYAMLAGLPAIHGLYAGILPIFAYAIFGTSRQLAVGPAAMVALLVSSGIGGLGALTTENYIYLAIILAGMIGVIQLGMGLFRLGYLTNFLSHPVISGFTSAAALIIIVSQTGLLLGIQIPRSESLITLLSALYDQVNHTHAMTLIISTLSLGLMLSLKYWAKGLPNSMILLLVATAVVWFFRLDLVGVSVVGNIPQGFPDFIVPSVSLTQIQQLIPTALAIAFIGFIESIAVAKKMARENRYELEPNKELIGLGMANIVGSLFQSMPVAGGLGRSAVNNAAGARTQLASIITAVCITLALLFLTPMFYFIPKAVLGVVIVVAVYGLIDFKEVTHLWRVKKEDLALLALTFVSTLIVGVKEGILIGIAVSLLWFLAKTTRPHFAVMGRVGQTTDFRNIKRFAVETDPTVLILRFDSQFYYGNVSFLKEKIREYQNIKGSELKAIVIDACSVNQLDSSADTALHELIEEGRLEGIEYFFASVKGPVLDVMKLSGFYDLLGPQFFFFNVHDAVTGAKNWIDKKNEVIDES